MSSVLLQADKLFCERDDRILFEDLSFTLSEGEVLRVEGPNGAGKTTLLRILSGLMPLHDGKLLWKGEDIAGFRHDFLQNLLFLGHKTGVKMVLSPIENLKAWCSSRFRVTEEALIAALEKVRLGGYEHVPCHSLSAGQQRRVALARLHLSKVPLWILDEAFTAIDKDGVAELEQWIAEKADQGGAVVLTTHHAMNSAKNIGSLQLGGR